MIYIYEGVDLTGKSTLSNKRALMMKIPIIKKKLEVFKTLNKEYLSTNQIEVMTQMFFESIYPLGVQYDFILDRSLLSSLVYSKYFKRTVNLDYVYKYLFDPDLSKNIKISLITSNNESLKNRFETRGEKLFTLDELLFIQGLYIDTAKTLIEGGCTIIQIIENNDHADISSIS